MSSEVYLFDVCGGNQVIFWPNRLVADEVVNQADSMMKTKIKLFFQSNNFWLKWNFFWPTKGLFTLPKFFCKTENDSDINRQNCTAQATLDDVTPIGSSLFVSHYPWRPRQVLYCLSRLAVSSIFTKKALALFIQLNW